jgi:large subunit ribosomal protein L15
MLDLSNLSPYPGATKQRKRLGRGHGSGHGKTSGRGHKGFKARSGSGVKPGFEGGQMPLQRRIPKRGFTNIFKKEIGIVNVQDLDIFEDGAVVTLESLIAKGLVGRRYKLVKILGNGDLSRKITVKVDKVSESARKKIDGAGGTVEE